VDPFAPLHYVPISGLRLLRDPDTLRKHVERLTIEERRALRASEREIAAYKERLASLGRKRSGHFDQQAEVLISMTELRYTLDALNAERELRRFEDRGIKLRQFEALPNLVEGYLRDLPNLLDHAPPVRDYETVPEERTPENPLG
jgi:hypothetical protein